MAKYQHFDPINLKERLWPDNVISSAPIWCSVDLRDGNQALAKPMSVEQKLDFFDLLVKIGFKQIEVGFPSSSKTEYDFLRRLIDENRVPDDVTLQVLSQARPHLIKSTFECLKGLKKVIFHIYNSLCPTQRKYTFGMSKDEVKQIALDGVKDIKQNMKENPELEVQLEYSPEDFGSTEIDFAIEVCEEVKNEWMPTQQNKIIFNLPTSVECISPNSYADRIEYFSKNISEKEKVIISLHNHNDMGTGVASCQMGLLAGAERVEGTLFGNGERTGNLDIVNVALNLYSQGIDPKLDLYNIPEIAKLYASFTGMEISPRHPYAGSLVFTSFSGSHQDAIRKALKARKNLSPDSLWQVPYLLIDPRDIGREYEEVIRITSQSGKGGAAWILEQDFGLSLPKDMYQVLGEVVTNRADYLQRELSPDEIYDLFESTWLDKNKSLKILDLAETHIDGSDNSNNVLCRAIISLNGVKITIGAKGNGPLDAFVAGLKEQKIIGDFTISEFSEHSIGTGSDTDAMAYIKIKLQDKKTFWGVGRSSNVARAGIDAVVSAINTYIEKS